MRLVEGDDFSERCQIFDSWLCNSSSASVVQARESVISVASGYQPFNLPSDLFWCCINVLFFVHLRVLVGWYESPCALTLLRYIRTLKTLAPFRIPSPQCCFPMCGVSFAFKFHSSIVLHFRSISSILHSRVRITEVPTLSPWSPPSWRLHGTHIGAVSCERRYKCRKNCAIPWTISGYVFPRHWCAIWFLSFNSLHLSYPGIIQNSLQEGGHDARGRCLNSICSAIEETGLGTCENRTTEYFLVHVSLSSHGLVRACLGVIQN